MTDCGTFHRTIEGEIELLLLQLRTICETEEFDGMRHTPFMVKEASAIHRSFALRAEFPGFDEQLKDDLDYFSEIAKVRKECDEQAAELDN